MRFEQEFRAACGLCFREHVRGGAVNLMCFLNVLDIRDLFMIDEGDATQSTQHEET